MVTNNCSFLFRFRVDFRSSEKEKPKFFGWASEFQRTEDQRFVMVRFGGLLTNGEPRFVQCLGRAFEEWKNLKIRSGGLPKNGK
ncbi:hypothetical protein RIR_jg37265.t1 [Rhizophagus irregularis DAOM 181602=DAOM 197198]|nr:hypothetical protein RIR_jg37265.t1 [Rhizophagus irregularis DAOM 181602=DAOM 197198]